MNVIPREPQWQPRAAQLKHHMPYRPFRQQPPASGASVAAGPATSPVSTSSGTVSSARSTSASDRPGSAGYRTESLPARRTDSDEPRKQPPPMPARASAVPSTVPTRPPLPNQQPRRMLPSGSPLTTMSSLITSRPPAQGPLHEGRPRASERAPVPQDPAPFTSRPPAQPG